MSDEQAPEEKDPNVHEFPYQVVPKDAGKSLADEILEHAIHLDERLATMKAEIKAEVLEELRSEEH